MTGLTDPNPLGPPQQRRSWLICGCVLAYLVDYLFLSREGRPISQRTVQRLVARYAQVAGLENVSSQTLWTTFAHAMFEGTKDLKS